MPSRFLLAPLSVALSMVLASPAWAGSTGVTNADAAADALQHSPTDLDTVEVRGERDRGYNAQRTRRSEEHTSELQSLMRISYAVFCLKKKNKPQHQSTQQPNQ